MAQVPGKEGASGPRSADLTDMRSWLAKLRSQPQPTDNADATTSVVDERALGPARTLVVSPAGPADYPTVTEAIRKAPPGSRILIRPGRYDEGIVLDKPLEIIGDGPREQIVFENPDAHCVVVRTKKALVRGLTLHSRGECKGNRRSAVDIPEGELLLEDCTLSSDTLASVFVHGSAANPTIRHCRLFDGKASGIQVSDDARATVEECEFVGNADAGLLIRTGGNPLVRCCRFHDGRLFGILVDEWGRGTVEACEFSAHAEAGIAISGGTPLVRKCRIHNERVGLLAFGEGGGTLEECIFDDNEIGVLTAEGGNPLVRSCQIHNARIAGVSAKRKGRGTVEDCTISRCTKAGVHIIEVSNPVIRGCLIQDGPEFGIFVTALGVGTIEECDISGHGLAEVAVASDGNPLIRHCRLHDGKRFGLSVQLKGQARVVGCDIYNNALTGVLIRTQGNPTVRQCRINRNKAEAVRVRDQGCGTFEDCDLTANGQGAWSIESNCRVQARGNKE
jgi:F-box protein 11